MKLFDFIKAANFFPTYAPQVRNWKHKMRGVDGNKKPIDFSDEDRNQIKQGVKQLLCDPCNYGLGFYEKHKDKYIEYLKKHD